METPIVVIFQATNRWRKTIKTGAFPGETARPQDRPIARVAHGHLATCGPAATWQQGDLSELGKCGKIRENTGNIWKQMETDGNIWEDMGKNLTMNC